MGGQPLAQRLHDKPPLWGARGLLSLVPECIAQGLIGHPFVCPDMVGAAMSTIAQLTGRLIKNCSCATRNAPRYFQ
jgi:hypothetical protein